MLTVRSLSKRFGGFLAVNQVSFEVRQGEILGLIGPNGSGKSTIFNLISGALRPSSGSIVFAGAEIAGQPAHVVCRRGVARTFQIPRPFRKLSLLDNVGLAAFYGAGGAIARSEAQRRAGEHDRAGARPQRAGDQVEDRALARAVGADEPEDLALPHLERYLVDGQETAEALRQALDREHLGSGSQASA